MDNLFGPASSSIVASTRPPKVGRAFSSSYAEAGHLRSQSPSRGETSNGVEELFAHDSVKVVAFSPPTSALQKAPRRNENRSPEGPPAGTLPWHSPTETTISSGE